ncbi:hypothetical protein C8J56DRAFT_1049547 [Mycena floridula]|nr:hypothetical protein C8J56DRAFT_1049547 [Mycena floridula]
MADALTSLLEDKSIKDHPTMSDFGPHVKEILKAMHGDKATHTAHWFPLCGEEATVEWIAGIDFDEIASKIQTLAPDLWNLIELLLDATPYLRTRGGKGVDDSISWVHGGLSASYLPSRRNLGLY